MQVLLELLALYLPFQLAINPSSGVDLASIRVLILGISLLWIAKGLKDKKITIKREYVAAYLVIFLFSSLISVLWARNDEWAWRKILFLFSVCPLYFVFSAVVDGPSRMMKVAKMLIYGGFLVSIIGIAQFFGQFILGLDRVYKFWADFVIWPFLGHSFSQAVLQNPSWLVNISGHNYLRATATFPDPHMLSFFLGLLIPMALAMYMACRKRIYLVFVGVMLLSDLLTFSRGGYLGLFCGIIFLVVYFWGKIGYRYKIAGAVIMMALIITLIVPSPISRRFASSFDLREGSNQGRLETWGKAITVAIDHPIFGVGIGNYPIYIKPTADYREPIYAHNTYLDIWSETGLMALLAWIGISASAFYGFMRRAGNDVLFLGGAIGIVIFSIHSLVETAIYSPVVLALLMIIIAFSQITITKDEKIS